MCMCVFTCVQIHRGFRRYIRDNSASGVSILTPEENRIWFSSTTRISKNSEKFAKRTKLGFSEWNPRRLRKTGDNSLRHETSGRALKLFKRILRLWVDGLKIHTRSEAIVNRFDTASNFAHNNFENLSLTWPVYYLNVTLFKQKIRLHHERQRIKTFPAYPKNCLGRVMPRFFE